MQTTCARGLVSRSVFVSDGDSSGAGTERWELIVRRYMNFCFGNAAVPRVSELAAMLSMSREQVTRAFRAATGRSPAATFRDLQIRRAVILLEKSDLTTMEIARATGFGSVRAFYRTFRRQIGATPTQYRSRTGGSARRPFGR